MSYKKLFPGVAPHIGVPPAFIFLDQVKIGAKGAVVNQAILPDTVRNITIGFVVAPTALAHEAVKDQDFLVRQLTAVGEAPLKNFEIRFASENLSLNIFVVNL